MLHLPRSVPIRCRRIGCEMVDAREQGERGAVAGRNFQRSVEASLCLVPARSSVGGERLGIAGAELALLRGELAASCHHLEDRLRYALAYDRQAIDLAQFEGGTGCCGSVLRDQDAGAVELVRAL